ncbi:MAG: NHL repeat-containing protein [Chloroflexota bacterium]
MEDYGGTANVRRGRPWLALGCWLAALPLAFLAEYALTGREWVWATSGFTVATGLAAGAAWLGGSRWPSVGSTVPEAPRAIPARALLRSPELGLGLALIAVAVGLRATVPWQPLAHWPWLLGLVLVPAAVWRLERGSRAAEGARGRFPWADLALLAVLVAVAAAMRFPSLEAIPPEVHGDEAVMGLEARRLMTGAAPTVFATGWNDFPMLSFGAIAVSMLMAGDNLYGLRFGSAVLGVLCIPLTYALVRLGFGRTTAAAAAFFVAVSQWHIHYSRVGLNNMQAVVATLLLLLLGVLAAKSRRPIAFLGAGMAVGVCFSVYFAARLAPVILGVFWLHRLAARRSSLSDLRAGLPVAALGALVFLAPMIPAAIANPSIVISRTSTVSVLEPKNTAHALAAHKVESFEEMLGIQLLRAFGAMVYFGESSQQYAHRAPLFDWFTAGLLIPGLVLALLRIRQPRFSTLLAWIVLTLVVGGALTIDALFSPRVVAVIPAIATLAGLMISTGWRVAERLPRPATIIVGAATVAVFGASGYQNWAEYFQTHVTRHQPPSYFTVLARFLEANPDRHVVFFPRPTSSLGYDTVRFLQPAPTAVEIGAAQRPFAVPDPTAEAPRLTFLVDSGLEDRAEVMATIRAKYPDGRLIQILDIQGARLFDGLLVNGPAASTPAADVSVADPHVYRVVMVDAPSTPAIVGAQGSEGTGFLIEGAALGAMVEPRFLARDRGGSLYVSDRLAKVVWRLDASMRPVAALGASPTGIGLLEDPRGVAIGLQGELLVLDAALGRVVRLRADGSTLPSIPIGGTYSPSGMAMRRDGVLLIADTGQGRLLGIGQNGAILAQIKLGVDGRPLRQPVDVAVTDEGVVYVVDGETHRVIQYSADLQPVREWPAADVPTTLGPHVAVLGNRAYLTDPPRRAVQPLGPSDDVGPSVVAPGVGRLGAILGAGDRLYAVDAEAKTIVEIKP